MSVIVIDRIHRMDALAGLAKLDDASVDLVATDPPYNIASAAKQTIRHGKLMSTKEAWGAWDTFDPFDYELWICQVISQCYRVLKPGGALYMFTAREDNGHFIRRAVQRGFTYRQQLVIVKKNPLPSFAKSNWRSATETCLYVTKGKPSTFNFISQPECVNVYHHPTVHRLTDHPTEKPLGLLTRIVQVSSNTGDLVVDPFMGSGTTAVAAKRTGRRFIGFETDAGYVRMARERLATVKEGEFLVPPEGEGAGVGAKAA
jgi:site-specific DNA-methyltransferase (adenine-specific)